MSINIVIIIMIIIIMKNWIDWTGFGSKIS